MSSEVTPVRAASVRTATPASVRAVNRAIVLELIRRRQPVSRADLARLTGAFRSSISDIVDDLVEAGLVCEERAQPSSRGRVPMSLRLNDDGHAVLGLNIRPRQCEIALAGLTGRIRHVWRFETPSSPARLVSAVARRVREIGQDVQRIGVAAPGHVHAATGRILWTPTHPEFSDFPIAEELSRATGIPVLADNDCNAGTLSELWLRTEKKHGRRPDFVFLNVSDFGTGAGAVVNGELCLGHDGHFAAEFGHMVVAPGGIQCGCGRRGCWEQYVSNFATWQRFHPRTPYTEDKFAELETAARAGDKRALDSIAETAHYLSLGISNIGYVLNPAEIVVAGRITAVWDLIERDVAQAYGSPQLRCDVRPASLSADDSLLHGTVCLALSRTFATPHFGEAVNVDGRYRTLHA
jgi:predicted NBD/HSP70 family sugar kinase